MYKCILITGASSGIGKALAEHYASPSTTLLLTGRDEKRLEEVEKSCSAKGAVVVIKAIDVKDRVQMEKWLMEVDATHPIDLVIANAGVSSRSAFPDRDEMENVLKTNIDGVLNTILPLIPPMRDRRNGHLAVVSSLAAYKTFPGRGPYSASKAAIKMFCDDWRLSLEPFNIAVSTICPGFIKTPLTDRNAHPMPFLLEADESAHIITKGLAKKKAIIAFPTIPFIFMRFMQCLPVAVSDFFIRLGSKRV